MHDTAIPDWVKEHVRDRRGRLHVCADMEPEKTALLVVDLQRGFMDPEVAHSLVPYAVEIVPVVNRLASTLRAAGGRVVFLRMVATEQARQEWSVYYDDLTLPERRAARFSSMQAGGPGHELWPGLDVGATDLIVDKTRFSAFIQGSSDLEAVLRRHGIDTVLVTGTVTNTCCDSTARDAMMRNFRTVMIADANAARTDEAHNAALQNFFLSFGDVMTTEEAENYLTANAQTPKLKGRATPR
jgi:ureidoacrylate peracid hydrolase